MLTHAPRHVLMHKPGRHVSRQVPKHELQQMAHAVMMT